MQRVCDIIDAQSAPESCAAHDPEMPGLIPCDEVDNDDGIGGVWSTIDGETVLLEDFEGFEEALLAETQASAGLAAVGEGHRRGVGHPEKGWHLEA